jgi:hypothetical protein
MLFPAAFAVALGVFNADSWHKINAKWHLVQWVAVAALGLAYVLIFDLRFMFLFVYSSTHWIFFELALYKRRGLDFRHVGTTALTDRWFRSMTGLLMYHSKNRKENPDMHESRIEANAQVFKFVFKWFYWFASISLDVILYA